MKMPSIPCNQNSASNELIFEISCQRTIKFLRNQQIFLISDNFSPLISLSEVAVESDAT